VKGMNIIELLYIKIVLKREKRRRERVLGKI
jgi:hypothetical protein